MKSKLLTLFIILLTIFIIYLCIFPTVQKISKPEITTTSSPFTIKKQIFYSGIMPKNTTYSNNENWILSISQYTDIAFYIERNSKQLTDSNTINSIYIDNIKFIKKPILGTPALYYHNPLNFGTDKISTDFPIDTHLSYNILNFENNDNFNYYYSPNFFTDCSIPITLKYVNSNIIKDFKLPNSKTLVFNGSILKNANIKLESLNTKLSFCINIITNDNNFYKNQIELDIPLSNSEYNLLEQNIYLENEINSDFKSYTNENKQ